MADPIWSDQYDYSKSPEDNNYSRVIYSKLDPSPTGADPVITEKSTEVEIDSNNGSVVFVTENPVGMEKSKGITVDFTVTVTGVGHAGVELTFMDCAILVQIYESRLEIYCPQGRSKVPWTNQNIATMANSNITYRITYDETNGVSVYRGKTKYFGPALTPKIPKPYNRILWWGEGGGKQVFHSFKYYFDGTVVP
jgi:hypothetical protein